MSNSELFVADTEMKVFEFGLLQSSLKPILRPKLEILIGGLREKDGFQIQTPAEIHSEEQEEQEEEEAIPSSQKHEISKTTKELQVEEEEDGCRTPTSLEHKITGFQNCPPAPKKPKSAPKRRASDFFYSCVDPDDLESLFRPILARLSDNSGQKIKKTRREEIQ